MAHIEDGQDFHANAEPAVSMRVAVRLDSGATLTGTIIDDFGGFMPSVGEVGVRIDDDRSVTLRRWGIAADDGTLLYVDDGALTVLDDDDDAVRSSR